MQFGNTGNPAPIGASNGVLNLSKGQKVNLSKVAPSLSHIMVGLGWDANKYSGGDDFDLDASAFLCDANGKSDPDNFVFYGNMKHKSGAVEHTGDNRTGDGEGDDEAIKIDLSLLPSNIERIAITATIYDAKNRKQTFGQVSNAYIRLVDMDSNKEILRYDLGEDFSSETAIVFAEIYKHNGDWKFNAIGAGFDSGLAGLCANYGIEAENG